MTATLDEHHLPELTPDTYLNRELAWIEFNRRVLAVAQDTSVPLLERIKFLAIFSNNLDEFYMVRVASVHEKMKLGVPTNRPDGIQPGQLLMEIREHVLELVHQQRVTMREIFEQLEQHGIRVASLSELETEQREALRAYFQEEVFPVLTPLAVDHVRPFPFISNLSLNLVVWLKRDHKNNNHQLEFVRLKVPAGRCGQGAAQLRRRYQHERYVCLAGRCHRRKSGYVVSRHEGRGTVSLPRHAQCGH
jgi:polyphosphate kinase